MSESVGFVLPRLVDDPRRRNADGDPFYQWKLRDYLRALVDAYGWRQDFEAPNHKVVPYLPVPFARAMMSYFDTQADYWLAKSIPDAAKQPQFIKNKRANAIAAIGALVGDVFVPNTDDYEHAPAAVAAKAPTYYRDDLEAGKPSPLVLKAQQTWDFLYAIDQLAIHFDGLTGVPTKLDLFVEALKETIDELPERLRMPFDKGREWLGVVAAVAVGLAALWVVTR